jgi:hypothetical protein
VSTPPSTNQADLRLRVLDRVLRRMGPPVGDRTPQQLQQLREWESPDTMLANLVFGRPARQVDVV